MAIFIDTGAFIARYLQNDIHHKEAQTMWQELEQSQVKLITSNFILDETLTLLGRKAHYTFAAKKGRAIYNSVAITITRPEPKDELAALETFETYAEHKLSFTDCVSFVLMKKLRLHKAFTFDKHFHFMGFDILSPNQQH